jgi:hypothetical protein
MPWLDQTQMERRPGTPGEHVFIIDSSGSMVPYQDTIDAEFKALKKAMPKARLFVYGEEGFEIKMHQFGENWVQHRVGNGTKHRLGWRLIRNLTPEATFFLSDAHSHDTERAEVLRIVENLTGAVHVFYSERNPVGEYEQFMRRIARIGGGQFFGPEHIAPGRFRRAIHRAIQSKQETPMAKQQLPDKFLEDADEFDFQAPDDMEVDLRQNVRLIRGTKLQEVWAAPEWQQAVGGPHRQSIGIQSADVTVHEPQQTIHKGFLGRAAGWLTSTPESPAIADYSGSNYSDRGQIIDASYAPVHAPQEAHRALPAPQASSGYYLPPPTPPAIAAPGRASFTPQLTNQSQTVPMGNASAQPVRAKFTRG